ncbi:MAG: hypothetical protein RL385_2690 [Pseudomonadota bacterium]|jgi:LysR family glycine cleavage system transcriptional activator
MRPLPPIQLLFAFEAAARLGSFKLAARELHLTPSAISQQLKALEESLGLTLFERSPRAISLSEAGNYYLEVARETLDTFRRGTERLHERFALRRLRVSCDAVVAYELIIPGLLDFQTRHPDIDLRVETSSALVDPRGGSIDAGVRFGRGPWPGLCADELAAMVATPVASRAYLRERPLRRAQELGAHTLIDVAGAPDYWSAVGTQLGFRIARRRSFDSYLSTLQAAAHGSGVALGLFPLSTAWLSDGRLEAPLPLRVPGGAYHLVYRPEERERSDLTSLRDWILQRFAALPPLAAAEPA